MVSSFSYFDTDWGMMSNVPRIWLRPLLRNRLLRARSAGARSDRRAHFADGPGVAAALVAVIPRHAVRFALRLSRRQSGFGDDASAGDPQLLPVYVLRHPAGDLFGQNILLIFVAIGMVSWLDMARIVRGQTLSLKRKVYRSRAGRRGLDGEHRAAPYRPQRAGGWWWCMPRCWSPA